MKLLELPMQLFVKLFRSLAFTHNSICQLRILFAEPRFARTVLSWRFRTRRDSEFSLLRAFPGTKPSRTGNARALLAKSWQKRKNDNAAGVGRAGGRWQKAEEREKAVGGGMWLGWWAIWCGWWTVHAQSEKVKWIRKCARCCHRCYINEAIFSHKTHTERKGRYSHTYRRTHVKLPKKRVLWEWNYSGQVAGVVPSLRSLFVVRCGRVDGAHVYYVNDYVPETEWRSAFRSHDYVVAISRSRPRGFFSRDVVPSPLSQFTVQSLQSLSGLAASTFAFFSGAYCVHSLDTRASIFIWLKFQSLQEHQEKFSWWFLDYW